MEATTPTPLFSLTMNPAAVPPPPTGGDPRAPLLNLSLLGQNMDNLRRFLSQSIDRRSPMGDDQLQLVSSEISSAVHHIILNGAALLASLQPDPSSLIPDPIRGLDQKSFVVSAAAEPVDRAETAPDLANHEIQAAGEESDCEIVEIDAVELLAEHIHFCEVCGKGFKRDANLRMHMRAHGNRFKTLEALTKPLENAPPPPSSSADAVGKSKTVVKFSCPMVGCNRNRAHQRFRALKSAVCVKNHFKRSHCPKMYSCSRCNMKSFSVMADLKSHQKHCGERRWRCSCGTRFSRKDKLFGHLALFEGHAPAVEDEDCREKGKRVAVEEQGDEEEEDGEGIGSLNGGCGDGGDEGIDPQLLDSLMEEFEAVDREFLDSFMGCSADFCDL